MQFVAWLGVCLVLSWALRRQPIVLTVMGMTLWVLVPGLASPLVLGDFSSAGSLHPAALFVLAVSAVQFIASPRYIMGPLVRRPEWGVLLTAVSVVALAVSLFVGSGGWTDSLSACVSQVLGPVLLFMLVGAAVGSDARAVHVFRYWFVVVGCLEAAVALVQLAVQSPLLYVSQYEEQVFFRQNLNRWMGTTDHPLVLSLLLVLALFFVGSLSRVLVILPVTMLLLAGLLTTQSRVGVALGIVAIVYVVVRAPLKRPWYRAAAALPMAIGATIAVQSGAATAIEARVADDTGSTSARADALGYFVDHIGSYLWVGGGLNSSFVVSDNAGLGTSFESAFLMYAVDIGVVAATLYFGVMLWATVRSASVMGFCPTTCAAVMAFLVPQSFSALSGTTVAPMLVWAVFALAGFGPATTSIALRRKGALPGHHRQSSSLVARSKV